MSAVHLPNTATVEEVAEVITADGVCIVDRLADDSVMDAIEAELRVHIDASRGDIDPAGDFQPRRTGALVARSPSVRGLITHPLVLGTVERVLDGDGGFQLHLTEVITVDPGGEEQFVHRDHWVFGYPWPQGQEVMCNTLWALTPFTESNGATRLIPGSNHFEDGRIFDSSDTEAAEMERGSLLIYTGSLYHGGGANRTETPRSAINLTYSRSWLRQEENQYLSIPLEVARTLDNDLLRLVGYQRGALGLGSWSDRLDPLTYVKPDEGSAGVMPDVRTESDSTGDPDAILRRLPDGR